MRREEMADLTAFAAVAEERSFTKAAAKLGMSQSALSQIIKRVEERLGVPLLTRTTRSVAPTEAGDAFLRTLVPALEALDASLASFSALRETPAGRLRITSVEHASQTILAPALAEVLPKYPALTIEIINDYGLTDIVAGRFDAGVRLGEQVDQDMIAVRIGPDFNMAVVGSPAYFKSKGRPHTPHDLTDHSCIGLRLPTSGGLWSWPFIKAGRELNVRPRGQMVLNTITLALDAALSGLGLAYLPEDVVRTHVAKRRLVHVLKDWTPPASGYHLYFPRRRQPMRALSVLVDELRYRE